MELNHIIYPSHTATPMCTYNDVLNVAATPLPNLENYLDIDIPGITNFVSLSNTLFSEEERHYLSTPTCLEERMN